MIKKFIWLCIIFVIAFLLQGCGQESAEDQAQHKAESLNSSIYLPKHNIEARNYNLRQKVADNPSTILWCTFFPPGTQGTGNGSTPGQAITVPIAGKLTSSGKRPYDSEPGPDGMFGNSAEYRYGFDPTLSTYYDFTGLASFCTTEPTVWQSTKTQIVVQTDSTLSSLSKAAERSTSEGSPQGALNLLKQAESESNKKQGR